jgi:predicted metal-dependent phosphotriesterase family hydrolase
MAKNSEFEDKLQGFANRVKTEPVQLPIQKVTPIQLTTSPKEEQQLNVWIPKDLMKRLKVKGAETDKSLKEMVIEALERFL